MTETHVWLTLASGIETILLLAVLFWAARQIQKALEIIQRSVAKIHWGVRAIEQETNGLRGGLPQLRETLVSVVGGVGVIADGLTAADAKLAALAGDTA